MDKLLQGLKSRTVWCAVAGVIINTVPMVHNSIPAVWLPLVDAVVGLLTIYFRVVPKQNLHPIEGSIPSGI